MTKTTRTIGTITIASSSIRTIGAIVKICKRLNGNHSRMTRTIEAIQMYPKEKNSAINRLPLGLYALFYRTPAKEVLPHEAQTVQYRLLRRSRRLYGNQKSSLSCRSSGSSQKAILHGENENTTKVSRDWCLL